MVSFSPLDTAQLAVFKSTYGLTNMAVTILGPYSGKLGNRSDRVAVEAPQYPDLPGDSYSWVIEDEVIYGNQDPWPATAHGAGFSLTRLEASGTGNDPGNWIAAPPTPGQQIRTAGHRPARCAWLGSTRMWAV